MYGQICDSCVSMQPYVCGPGATRYVRTFRIILERRSTADTLNMGAGAGTGEALAWAIASDVPSTSPGHRTNSGALGEAYSMHTYAFKQSCVNDSCNEPAALRNA